MTSATETKATKLFQFWDKPEPPKEVLQVMRSWKNHKGLRVHLFDEKKAKQFIRRKLGQEIVDAYNVCNIPAMKADFFRYCALYVHGGVYADADISLRPDKWPELKALMDTDSDGIIMTRERAIANDFIYVKKPEHPLIKKTLDQAISNIKNKTSNSVWEVTGPAIMTSFYKSESEKSIFDSFDITSFKVLREIVEFKWQMDYKKGDGHWTNAQEKKSIFKEDNKTTKDGQ